MIGIRGAVRVPRNDREAIYHETQRLLRKMAERNGFTEEDVVAAFFTMTPDLNADFPAYAARSMGWTEVPMLGAQETAVPGALDRTVRVLLQVEIPGPAHHVYLGEAAAMRPDLAEAPDAPPVGEEGEEGEEGAERAPAVASEPAAAGPVLVCGLGLIGGSAALVLRRSSRFGEVLGQDPDPRARELARSAGAVAAAEAEEDAFLDRAAVVLLAMPVEGIVGWLERWGPRLRRGTVVLDVGSTKAAVVRAMDRLPEGVEAIGTHPMAGSELSGMAAARPDLFFGSTWALVETSRTGTRARELVTALVEEAGARALFVEPEVHDRAVATSSHLPYLLSVALTLHLAEADPTARALSGPGLRDMTRLAASDPGLMAGILSTNWPHVREALEGMSSRLDVLGPRLEGLLEGSEPPDIEALRRLLREARRTRETLV